MLDELAGNEQEKYATFWKEFGRVLKEGIGEDHANRERIAKLLRFASTHADTEAEDVALAEYVGRMKTGQEAIYYVTAESFLAARNSPHLEVFRAKGVEVLLLHDRVDEWVVANLPEFDGKRLVSVARGDLDLAKLDGEEAKAEQAKNEDEYKEVLARLKAVLESRVKDVRVSTRLTSSPACLVADELDLGGNLQRILKAVGQNVPQAKPILEVNPAHLIMQRLKHEERRFDDWAHLLFEQSLLAEGGTLEDPAGFVRRMNELMLELTGQEASPSN